MNSAMKFPSLAAIALSLSACVPDPETKFRARCEAYWADFENRLLITEAGDTTYYACQVRIDGKWVNETAVKFAR